MPAGAKPEKNRITEPHGPDYDRLSAIATLRFDIFFQTPAYKNVTPYLQTSPTVRQIFAKFQLPVSAWDVLARSDNFPYA